MGSSRELVKLYYRIGEVAQIVGVQPHVLRYWETEFRTIRPQKSHKGQRVYSRRDVEKLLKVKDLRKNQGFTIAGEDKTFYNATAKIEGETVVVTCDKVAAPKAVRFGWANYPVVNLWNKDGLPASTFRTDDWKVTKQDSK